MEKSLLNSIKNVHENVLMYRIELNKNDLIQLLDQSNGYNNFDPIKIKEFVEKVDKKFHELYKDRFFSIRFIFGREYSPVLYIKVNTINRDLKSLYNSINQLKRKIDCNEFNIREDIYGDCEIRIWWD
jgi:hypothetical protein